MLAGIEYLADLGEKFGSPFAEDFPGFQGRRRKLKQAMATIQVYERNLFEHFVGGLLAIPGLNFYGLQDPSRFNQRTPTAAFNLAGRSPRYVAEELGKRGIYVWAGNFYALAFTEWLGLEKTGGVVRAGLVHYNTHEEVDYCLKCLRELK
jgi:selenocysteine lyase/cysteine desulfurase